MGLRLLVINRRIGLVMRAFGGSCRSDGQV